MLLDRALEERYQNLPTDSCHRVLVSLGTTRTANLSVETPGQIEELFRNIDALRGGSNAEELRQEASRTCMYVHTSGSTGKTIKGGRKLESSLMLSIEGHPKAISWSHSFLVGLFRQAGDDYEGGQGRVTYTPLPIFHVRPLVVKVSHILIWCV